MIIGIDASRAFGKERTGTENYSYHLITHMLRLTAAKQHQFVLYVRANTVIPQEIELQNVQIVEIKLPYLWTQLGLAAKTWTSSLDVLWVPAHTLPVFRRSGLKTVVTIHGLEYEWLPEYRNWLQRWYLPLSTKYAVASATKLIAVSNFTKNQLVKRLKAISKDIKVVHEGVALESNLNGSKRPLAGMSVRARVLNRWHLKEKNYLLFVGTVQPRKNIGFLLEAYAQIPELVRKQTKLVIAGSQGWMVEDVYMMPQQLGIMDQVVFTGRVSEVELEVLYQAGLGYVQPSITEGFGLPILEAMGRGLPVVASNGGALPEVVGEAGLVVPLKLELWVATLCKLIAEPRLRERLAAAGKWRVRAFGWDKAAKETLQILTTV